MSAAGRTFGGRYAVQEQVGSGGMAEVYRARDELLGRDVALKVLTERLSQDRSFVDRFRREAQAAANLNHPNVVSLYDYGSDDGHYFIVMEFIDGRPLSDVIRDEGPLMPERAAEIASDVSKALDRAHAAGLVHRDIKPANIMLTSQGQTKVTDFGIARALRRDEEQTVTQTGMVIGTAAYLSPEQAQGGHIDGRSDIYSLGCVLFEMLTGRPPFTGDTPLSVAYMHVRETPERPSALNPDVPRALDSITLKALSKNPDNRFDTAQHMADDLGRYLSGQQVTATPLMADETMVAPRTDRTEAFERDDYYEPERRGRPAVYVFMTLLILAIVGLLAYALYRGLVGGEPVRVPDVVNMDVEDARDEIEDVGLEVEIEERNSPRPAGVVLEQDPEAGTTAETGDTVTLTVSAGRRLTEVPDVEGLSLDEATEQIEDARLRVGEVTRESSDEVDEDDVISQDPPAGEEIPVRSPVDLVVSSGPEAVRVPDVVNQTEEQARAEIEAAGLEVEVERVPSDAPEGTVIAQEPEAGTEASPGDTVRITVSQGPEERSMPDVRGQDADEAEAFLEDEYGLNVGQRDARGPCAQPPGTVCDQDPDPGTSVSPGDSATLFVQAGTGGFFDGRSWYAWALPLTGFA